MPLLLLLQLPVGVLTATTGVAVTLSAAVGLCGVLVLASSGATRGWACVLAAAVTSLAAWYAFVVAPLALDVVSLLVGAAVEAHRAGPSPRSDVARERVEA